MSRIIFQPDLPVTPSEPTRTDVACFVGLVRTRAVPVPLPDSKRQWLKQAGWLEGPYQRNCDTLLNVPVPIENFAAFQMLYDDGTSAKAMGTDYLALAVNSFFAQGGKRCYVVRMGDPITKFGDYKGLISSLLGEDSFAGDQGSWNGVAHLWGLPDASILLLPDLPLLHAGGIQAAKPVTEDLSAGPERFVRCVPPAKTPDEKKVFALPAPRFTTGDYTNWGGSLRTVVQMLANERLREVQLVVAMPLPFENPILPALESPAQDQSVQAAMDVVFPVPDGPPPASSAFVQVAYPWLRSTRSAIVLESLEPPDGTLAGILARNALMNGTFNSAVKVTPIGVFDLFPELPAFETQVPAEKPAWLPKVRYPFVIRLSLFGFTPSGIRLLSDVTTYPGEAYRPARVNRLVSLLSRAARLFGEEHVFDHNGAALWTQLAKTLRSLLTRLWELNALEGAGPAQAFEVHCDRTTMTQNDIDSGRLIAVVSFQPAATLELITVTLTVEGGAATSAEVDAQLIGAL